MKAAWPRRSRHLQDLRVLYKLSAMDEPRMQEGTAEDIKNVLIVLRQQYLMTPLIPRRHELMAKQYIQKYSATDHDGGLKIQGS